MILCTYSEGLPALLQGRQASIVLSAHADGLVVLVEATEGSVTVKYISFQRPLGIAVTDQRFLIGAQRYLWDYVEGRRLSKVKCHPLTDMDAHEAVICDDAPWFVSTSRSSLYKLTENYEQVLMWRPKFVKSSEPIDACHLNGMAVVQGLPAFVTACSDDSKAYGWREKKQTSGCVIDVGSSEIVSCGFSMPHSPRWVRGGLLVLDSGRGALCSIDIDSGKQMVLSKHRGYVRGLAVLDDLAFVGLSNMKKGLSFPQTQAMQEKSECGLDVVSLNTCEILWKIRFEGISQIFDVQMLFNTQLSDKIYLGGSGSIRSEKAVGTL